jgi:2-phospho-L-lactate/phosphoenolpyruvate guanylyltransferase
MTTFAVLPVKRWPTAKRRLEADLSAGERKALAEAMLTDVLVALRRASRVDRVLVVTGEPAAAVLAQSYGADTLDDPQDAGHSAAATLGVREAVRHGATRALLVPGDCPSLEPGDVDALIAGAGPTREVVVVPDRHRTGTNALLLTPPGAIAPAFGPGSCERHLKAAKDARIDGRVAEVPSLLVDVDTVDDLEALRELLAASQGNAAHTRGLLSHWSRR